MKKRKAKKVMTVAITSLGIFTALLLTGCFFIKKSTNIDRTANDYQNRKIDFWNGKVPHKISGNPKYHDLKFGRYLFGNEHEEDAPYMLSYSLTDTNAKPAMIILPGGSYAFRVEKAEGIKIAEWLNSVGISAFVLNYRVEPYKHPVPLMDAVQAIKYLRTNAKKYHLNPNKIGVIGLSAGGHLAAALATHFEFGNPTNPNIVDQKGSRPDVLVLCYPVITMTGEHAHTLSIQKLAGENPSDSLLQALSTEKHVTTQTPPTFIWTTKTDERVDYQNSEMFADSLKAKGVNFEYHLFQKGKHGLGLAKGKNAGKWTTLCEAWLRKSGFEGF